MSMPLDQSIRIVLALSVAAATLMGFSVSASARYRSAIAAGVAGNVAGTIAGEALSGAMPPPGYNAPAYPPSAPRCWREHRQEFNAYSFHIGQVQVCD